MNTLSPTAPAGVPASAAAQRPKTESAKPGQLYAAFVRLVRKSHGWVGLWGAVFGLIFGFSGIWLNHRAILKLPAVAQEKVNAQLALPDPPPANAEEMSAWLQASLGLSGTANSVRVEHAKPVSWSEKALPAAASDAAAQSANPVKPATPKSAALMQPERWVFNFGGPNQIIQADYWRGNRSVGVTTTSNGLIATMTNMHKGTGMSIPWILLIDTWAGSMIFLSLSGVILWVQTNRRRAVGVAIFSVSLTLVLGITLTRL